MPNIERLTTLLEYVEKLLPEQIDMQSFRNECGTTACLMGYAVEVFPGQFTWRYKQGWYSPVDVENPNESYRGSTFFELNGAEWDNIFASDIPNEKAVSNLRKFIEHWRSNAEY